MTGPTPKPLLLVVTGRPGAGKTTLAHALARAIRCPAICRDEIKEGLINTTTREPATLPDDAGKLAYEAFFDTINLLLRHRVTLIAEAAFQHKLWAPKLQPLREIADVRIVLCTVDPQLARLRRVERFRTDPPRAQFHPDPTIEQNSAAKALEDYHPPQLDVPTLTVNTSNEYQPPFDDIVRFACS